MNLFESGLYELASLFLAPVLALILLCVLYAFASLGGCIVEWRQRRKQPRQSALRQRYADHGGNADDLELWIMRKLEWLRIVSRTAPMLGLIATMIPMGPALLALGRGDAASVGENLVTAFSAVILALISASITFFILTVRRRWLLQELRDLERQGVLSAREA